MSNNPALQIQQLYQRFGERPGISIELHKNLVAIAVTNDVASATVFVQGAQLAEYQRHGEKPVLWLSPDCDYQVGKPLRGGIPVCWPWFGALSRNPADVIKAVGSEQGPAHGLVRDRLWQVADIDCSQADCTVLTFELSLSGEESPLWQHPCRLQLTLTIGKTLSLSFNVENLSKLPFTYSSALHSYFAASAIEQIAIDGLEGCEYQDCLDDWQHKTQQGSISFSEEVDRLYNSQGRRITVTDKQWQRELLLATENSCSTIVWNPWIEKSTTLSCFDKQAYREMFCIETANAGQDCVTLKPGEQHSMKLLIAASVQ